MHHRALVGLLAGVACTGTGTTKVDDTDTTDAIVDSDPTDPVGTDSDTASNAETDDTDLVRPDLFDGPRFQSGSRITVQVWVSDGQDGSLASLYDTQLDAVCDIVPAGDGVLRCLPRSASIDAVFTESDCRSPVFVVPDDPCEAALYGRIRSDFSGQCGFDASYEVFPFVPTDAPATAYDGACNPMEVPAGPFYALNPVAHAPIDPTTFVGFDIVDAPGPGALGVRFLVGTDGTLVATGVYDGAGACTLEPLDGEADRCLPDERTVVEGAGHFGASDCATEALALDAREGQCDLARVVVARDSPSGPPTALFEVGARWHDEAFAASPSCRSVGLVGGPFYAVGDALHRGDFPELDVRLAGTSSLGLRVLTDGDGHDLLADPKRTFTLEDGTPCAPSKAVSGQTVCVPTDAGSLVIDTPWFSDAGCTERVYQLFGTQRDYGLVTHRNTCDGAAEPVVSVVAKVRAPWAGDLYEGTPSVCTTTFHSSVFGSNWVEIDPINLGSGLPTVVLEAR